MDMYEGNANLREQLETAEKEYRGTPMPFGMTGMSMVGYMSSRRSTMLSAHIQQFRNIENAEFPRLFTGLELTAGEYSSAKFETKEKCEIVSKIYRFDDSIPAKYNNYLMVIYYPKSKRYDIIKRKCVDDGLTESYGFRYNTDKIDSLEVGDVVPKNTVLYKSTSYDDNMNYGYGINATVMHTVDPYVIEDGLVISETFAEKASALGVTTPETSVNDNDILVHIYDNKPFPDVGEEIVNNVILSKKRIHNDRILFDMKPSELHKISFLNNKNLFGSGRVIDIMVLSNKEIYEFNDNPFNEQILKYLRMQKKYYSELYDITRYIIEDSGCDYSSDISRWYKYSKRYLDPETKFKDNAGNVFSNYRIIFTVEKENKLTRGQKLVARYGNKGVVADIRPDDEMPILDNGVVVDAMMNSLSPTNRLISGPLYELSINFITDRMVEHVMTLDDYDDRFEKIYTIISILNPDDAPKFKKLYESLSGDGLDDFYESLYEKGMFIRAPILWENETLYDKINKCYETYPDILKPYDVYIKKHGRMHKLLGTYTGYVGQMYLLNLKQTSQNDFSSRSISSINSRELPAKSDSAKKHRDIIAKTPIKFGYQETMNMLTSIKANILVEMHMIYRTSVKGRVDFGKKRLTSPKKINKIKDIHKYTSRMIEILNAKTKPLGIKFNFVDNNYYVDCYDGKDYAETYITDNGKVVIGSQDDFFTEAIREKLEEQYSEEIGIIESVEDYENRLEKEIQEKKDKLYGNTI